MKIKKINININLNKKLMSCNKCDNGLIEVDPRNPREAGSPQYEVCECMEEEAQYLEDTAYDDYEDN